MMKYILSCIIFTCLSCSEYTTDLRMTACSGPANSNGNFSRASDFLQIMQRLVDQGVPGISISIFSKEGWWHGAAGLAKIEDRIPMQPCHLQYLQSIAKTYMAVGILRLYEDGQIDLDAPIAQYLPHHSQYIAKPETITVRMLLNHTSGVPEYNLQPKYVTKLLQQPDHLFTPEDYLAYIKDKPLDFNPGSKYRYTNTNYLLLALIAEHITGDHRKYLSDVIFRKLGLQNTYYGNDPVYETTTKLVNSYWDRNSNGVVENASRLQSNNVRALIGDDGIIATPEDAVLFLRGLTEGRLISAHVFSEMQTWVTDRNGKPTYGIGLDYAQFADKNGIGHSGGGIGAGCQLYYFPEQQVYIFIGINLGTVTDSPIHENVSKSIDEIYQLLLN